MASSSLKLCTAVGDSSEGRIVTELNVMVKAVAILKIEGGIEQDLALRVSQGLSK